MTNDRADEVMKRLERICVQYELEDLSEAIRDTMLGPADEITDRLSDIRTAQSRIEDMLAKRAQQFDAAAKRSTRWTITIARWTVTINRGE